MCCSKVIVSVLALVAAASFVLIAALAQTPKLCSGQVQTQPQCSEDGAVLPVRGELRVLLVFAEVKEGCFPPPRDGAPWDKTRTPTGVPEDADDYFDIVPPPLSIYPPLPGTAPEGYLTDYYYQASFGEYVVLGDYLDELISIDCNDAKKGHSGTDRVVAILAGKVQSGSFATKHGFTIHDFDNWDMTQPGVPKIRQKNNKIDSLIVLWRNNSQFCGKCSCGFGVQDGLGYFNTNVGDGITGFDTAGTYITCGSGKQAWNMTIAEYFHALYGGNHWHTGGGAGQHTFLSPTDSFSTTGQSGSTSNVFNGWDRQHLGWKHPRKSHLISAIDPTTGSEVPTDLDITTHPNGGTFLLRDQALTGDAIRIKLPHIDHNLPSQPVKNQYLWLENHRLDQLVRPFVHNFDAMGPEFAGGGALECGDLSLPGVYAYIQVGKDQKEGTNIYASHPNSVGNWLYPLPAEGRFDFVYRIDRLQPGVTDPQDPNFNCNFGNANIPKDPGHPDTKPNPFTGNSDLAEIIDKPINGIFDGAIRDSGSANDYDRPLLGLSEVVRNQNGTEQVVHNMHFVGDSEDAFNQTTGKLELSLDTNPAPVPVYTYTHNPFNLGLRGYENRRIYLNGISIHFTELPSGDFLVDLRWDDYTVNKNVRWTGDIVLQNDRDDPQFRQSRINVASTKSIMLDQSLSPTLPQSLHKLADGTFLFALPTILTLESGTAMTLLDKSSLSVRSGSTLRVKTGAGVTVLNSGSVGVEPGSYICVESATDLVLANPASRLVVYPGANLGINPELGITLPPLWQQEINGTASSFDGASAVTVDAAGNVVAAGTTVNTNTSNDFTVVKLSGTSGAPLWHQEINGSANSFDDARAVTVDPRGDVIAAGRIIANSGFDLIAAKLSGASGALLWRQEINGPAGLFDQANAVAIDTAGDAIVAGFFGTGVTPDFDVAGDFTVVKLSGGNGTELWRRVSKGTAAGLKSEAKAVKVDTKGDVVAAGSIPNANSDLDFTVVKLSGASGEVLWRHEFHDSHGLPDAANAVMVDPKGDIVAAGSTVSATGDLDFTVVKLSGANGTVLWRQGLTPNGFGEARAVTGDPRGDVIAAGFIVNATSNFDLAVAKLSGANGTVLWRQELNGPANDFDTAEAAIVDAAGDVMVAGTTTGNSNDFIVVKLSGTNGAVLWRKEIDGSASGSDGAAAVTVDAAGDVVAAGTIENTDTAADFTVVKLSRDGAKDLCHDPCSFAFSGSGKILCRGDQDGDRDVDQADLNAILAARNTNASGLNDPRDLDRDGRITALDARKLALLCTRPRCATQ